MTLWNLFTHFFGHSQWNEHVERAAQQCAPQIWSQIPSTARQLPPAQRYGYLRARATRLVLKTVATQFSHSEQDRATSDVLQRVVDILLLQLRDDRRPLPLIRAA